MDLPEDMKCQAIDCLATSLGWEPKYPGDGYISNAYRILHLEQVFKDFVFLSFMKYSSSFSFLQLLHVFIYNYYTYLLFKYYNFKKESTLQHQM